MEITKNENRPVDAVVDIQEPNDTVNPMAPADTDRPEAQPCSCGGTPEEPKKKKCCGQCCVNLLTFVLAACVVALFVLRFVDKGASKHNPNATPAVVASDGVLKIAYVDTDSLMAQYQYAIDLQKELETYRDSREASYKQQMTQFQNDYQKYLKEGPNMTLAQQQAKEKELQARAEKLQGLEGELAMQVQQRTLEESEKMTRAVYAFIREYNAANQQFDLILAKSFSSSPVLYGNEGMDITKEIVEGLNEEYRKVKGKE